MNFVKEIFIKGAKENNLKNIDVHIPRDTLTVFTGLSGSGKSTLAFDTIFAEGQRRYMESLSSYARQFLGMMEKPDVESIEGLSPAISIDQKTTSHNPRSTVGTVTEIYDYLRLLYARVGTPHCPNCGREIRRQTVDEIADRVMELPEGSKIMVEAPVVRGRKGEYVKELASYRKSGYGRVDWTLYNLLSGGLILGAFFMATDYSTSPVTLRGQLLFGVGCGALTVLIRYFGSYPEGVSYAILIMNCCAWAIDRVTRGRQFGVTAEDVKAARQAKKEAKKKEKEAASV